MNIDGNDTQNSLYVSTQTETNCETTAQDNLRELQMLEFDVLKKITSICIQNHLQYFLAEGTLLGAIRHGGFIPWDDDVDVCMPRGDFKKFAEIAVNEMTDGYTCCLQNDTGGVWGTLRVSDTNHKIYRTLHGQEFHLFVSVDIFPIDGFPKSKILQKVHWMDILLRYCLFRSIHIERINEKKKRGLIFQLAINLATLIPFGKMLDEQKTLQYLTDALEKYTFSNSEMTINFYSEYNKKSLAVPKIIIPKSYFGDGRSAVFERESFFVPCEAEKVLAREYGDYMILPPREQRKPKHSILLIK